MRPLHPAFKALSPLYGPFVTWYNGARYTRPQPLLQPLIDTDGAMFSHAGVIRVLSAGIKLLSVVEETDRELGAGDRTVEENAALDGLYLAMEALLLSSKEEAEKSSKQG